MILQTIEGVITLIPILKVFILFLLMIIMIILYYKLKDKYIILILFLFSLIIGIDSISESTIPFTPYFQVFFLLFQSIIFLINSLEVYSNQKEKY